MNPIYDENLFIENEPDEQLNLHMSDALPNRSLEKDEERYSGERKQMEEQQLKRPSVACH